jgi:chromosome segregation ATPase
MPTQKKKKTSRVEWFKKNIVIVPVVAAIIAGTYTGIRTVVKLTDTITTSQQEIVNLQRDLKVLGDQLSENKARLSRAEATWDMAENLYRTLADQVREHSYDIKDLNR